MVLACWTKWTDQVNIPDTKKTGGLKTRHFTSGREWDQKLGKISGQKKSKFCFAPPVTYATVNVRGSPAEAYSSIQAIYASPQNTDFELELQHDYLSSPSLR